MREAITIDDIMHMNRKAGSFFFSKDTMRFFKSKAYEDVFVGCDGWYFVTSERFTSHGWADPRRYTVRIARDNGTIDDYDGFQKYATKRAAVKAAEKAAKDSFESNAPTPS